MKFIFRLKGFGDSKNNFSETEARPTAMENMHVLMTLLLETSYPTNFGDFDVYSKRFKEVILHGGEIKSSKQEWDGITLHSRICRLSY